MSQHQAMKHQFVPCAADLSIPAPLPLRGEERVQALRLRKRNIRDMCEDACIRCRVTGGITPLVVLWNQEFHGYTVNEHGIPIYVVAKGGLPQRKQQRALRIMEILAYGFNDYIARESVCERGYFIYPVTPDSGRLWLAEIGKRGGAVRSATKSLSSAENGRSHVSANA